MTDEVMGTRDNNDISRQFLSNVYGRGFYTPPFLCTYNMQDGHFLTTEKLGAQSPDWHG